MGGGVAIYNLNACYLKLINQSFSSRHANDFECSTERKCAHNGTAARPCVVCPIMAYAHSGPVYLAFRLQRFGLCCRTGES